MACGSFSSPRLYAHGHDTQTLTFDFLSLSHRTLISDIWTPQLLQYLVLLTRTDVHNYYPMKVCKKTWSRFGQTMVLYGLIPKKAEISWVRRDR